MGNAVRLSVLGTSFDLTIPADAPPSYAAAIQHAWSRCITEARGDDETPPLTAVAPADDSEEALRSAMQRLSQLVTRHAIGAQTGRLLMLHAGAVSHPETGKSLVYVAPSGTGKTTFSELLGKTHGYVTDETAAIDPGTGAIHPYPKPLSVSTDGSRRKVETSPDDLNLLSAHPAPTLGRLVLLRRDAELVGGPRTEELGTLDALLGLLPESSGTVRLQEPLQQIAALIDATGPVLRFTYREAEDVAEQAAALIGAGS